MVHIHRYEHIIIHIGWSSATAAKGRRDGMQGLRSIFRRKWNFGCRHWFFSLLFFVAQTKLKAFSAKCCCCCCCPMDSSRNQGNFYLSHSVVFGAQVVFVQWLANAGQRRRLEDNWIMWIEKSKWCWNDRKPNQTKQRCKKNVELQQKYHLIVHWKRGYTDGTWHVFLCMDSPFPMLRKYSSNVGHSGKCISIIWHQKSQYLESYMRWLYDVER